MTTIFEWAKSIYVLWLAPVALTPQHGWLLPAPLDVRVDRTATELRPTTACNR